MYAGSADRVVSIGARAARLARTAYGIELCARMLVHGTGSLTFTTVPEDFVPEPSVENLSPARALWDLLASTARSAGRGVASYRRVEAVMLIDEHWEWDPDWIVDPGMLFDSWVVALPVGRGFELTLDPREDADLPAVVRAVDGYEVVRESSSLMPGGET